MEANVINARLGALPQADVQKISTQKNVVACEFDFLLSPQAHNSPKTVVRLEIRKNFLVQIEKSDDSIVSGFGFDYSINFQIIRNDSLKQGTLGTPQRIDFIFTAQQNRSVSFYVKPKTQKEFERFVGLLERKYIVQRGFHHSFRATRTLNTNNFSSVYEAIRIKDWRQVAIKGFERERYFNFQEGKGKLAFLNEFKILTKIRHANFVKFLGAYESDRSTYIIMEYLEYPLHVWIKQYPPSINLIRSIMGQLLSGVNYLHQRGIMHRDLKLDNIMVKNMTNDHMDVVIIDFGLAEYENREQFAFYSCGTWGYMAPEVARAGSNDRYGCPVDIFSLGVIFHFLLFQKTLFDGETSQETRENNKQCNIDFTAEYFSTAPPEAFNLLKDMLEVDPLKRISAQAALEHNFFHQPHISTVQTCLQMQPF